MPGAVAKGYCQGLRHAGTGRGCLIPVPMLETGWGGTVIARGWHLPGRKISSAQGWPVMPPACPHQAQDTSRGKTLIGESQSP